MPLLMALAAGGRPCLLERTERAQCGTREGDALDGGWSQRTLAGTAYFIGFAAVWRVIPSEAGALPSLNRSLYDGKVEKDDEARSAAVSLLARGMITPAQAAELAGVSRQLVRYWIKAAGIDWRRAWERRQAGMWRREIAALNGKVTRPPSKRELRRRADQAKALWDAKHKPAH
jgi:predicted HTH domain antitoxin